MSTTTRVAALRPSPIRAVSRGAPEGAISLALGQPGWAMPPAVGSALSRWAASATTCGYGPNEGLPELVDTLTSRYAVPSDRVMVTAGSQAALYAVFTAHVEAGTRVLVPDPGFPAYRTLATLAGAGTTAYPLGVGGALDPQPVLDLLARHDDVSLVVLGHPGNPTGGPASIAALAAVAGACEQAGVLLLSDEVYRELHLGTPQPSVRDVCDRALVLESVSKGWAAPGLRVGWATGPPELLAPARLVHHAMNTAPSRPAQVAAAALLRASAEVLAESRRQVGLRWALVQDGPMVLRPEVAAVAGFYLWVRVPPWARADPAAFVLQVRDEGLVTVVPGSAFGAGGREHVRVSLGGPLNELSEGLARLAPWWAEPC